jgi:hypothetical protein
MSNVVCLVLAAVLVLAAHPPVFAQENGHSSTAAKPAEPTLDPDALPVSLEKIQRALSRPPAIRVTEQRAKFRVEVFGRKPTIEEILGPDFHRGPVAYGGMTHNEFLNMVTPKDVQGYAAFDNKQAAVVAVTSFAFQYALAKAIKKFQEAKQEREREEAKREVDEALAALREARRKAGLPYK